MLCCDILIYRNIRFRFNAWMSLGVCIIAYFLASRQTIIKRQQYKLCMCVCATLVPLQKWMWIVHVERKFNGAICAKMTTMTIIIIITSTSTALWLFFVFFWKFTVAKHICTNQQLCSCTVIKWQIITKCSQDKCI